VVLTKENGGRAGDGRYGPFKARHRLPRSGDKFFGGDKLFGGEDWPTALVVKAGEFRPTPSRDGHRWRARRDTDFYHIGMPTGVSLFVWLPEERAKWLEMDA
jgi:hypothetical protein